MRFLAIFVRLEEGGVLCGVRFRRGIRLMGGLFTSMRMTSAFLISLWNFSCLFLQVFVPYDNFLLAHPSSTFKCLLSTSALAELHTFVTESYL